MLDWTGIGRYTWNLLRELSSLEHDHEFVVLVDRDYSQIDLLKSWGYMTVKTSIAPYGANEQLKLGREIEVLTPDLVHFVHFNVPWRPAGPFVVTIHDLTLIHHRTNRGTSFLTKASTEFRRAVMLIVMRRAVSKAEWILTPSNATALEVREQFGRSQDSMTVTYEAAEELSAAPEPIPGLSIGSSTLLYVGNSYPYKNLAIIPAAMERVLESIPNLTVVLAGTSDVFRQRLLASLSPVLSRRVLDVGRVSDAQLAWLYRDSGVFVFPSFSEGFGLPGLEAMAHGLPVVASNTSSFPEIFGDAAKYFDPRDETNLANVLTEVLASDSLRRTMSEQGLRRSDEFSWRKMAEETLACYDKVLTA